MTRSSFGWVVAAGLLFGFAATSTVASRGPVDEKKEAPKGAIARNEKLEKLMQQRLDAARVEWDDQIKEFLAGRGTLEFLFNASRRLLAAEQDSGRKRTDRIAALEGHVHRMNEIYKVNKARFEAGRVPRQYSAVANYYRLDAEIMLERAKNADK